uniref:Uncharacterized protein n=1 Tax=Ditylenchus dipsaci TaxID=166011 RepID=A0A915E4B7_9BILA
MNSSHHIISDRSISIVRRNLLAVLFSDNIIRFYDVKICLERALFSVDFGKLMPDAPDTDDKLFHSGHAMGLVPQIVSFDFGPTVSSNGHDFATVFAMDSDGEIYFTAFNWTDLKCSCVWSSGATCQQLQLKICVCSQRLAFCTPFFIIYDSCLLNGFHEGVISHLVLVQSQSSDFLANHGKNIFELLCSTLCRWTIGLLRVFASIF